MGISESERDRRSEEIRKARDSVRLEGVILDEHIDGEIDKAEHSRLCVERIDQLEASGQIGA